MGEKIKWFEKKHIVDNQVKLIVKIPQNKKQKKTGTKGETRGRK